MHNLTTTAVAFLSTAILTFSLANVAGAGGNNDAASLSVSPSGHYVQYAGKTLMLIGDSGTQCVMQNLNLNYRQLLDDCAQRGLTAVHTWLNLFPAPSTERLAEKANAYGMYVAASLSERDGDRIHNTGVLIDRSGAIVGKYRKNHITIDEGLLDGKMPGDTYPVFQTDIGTV